MAPIVAGIMNSTNKNPTELGSTVLLIGNDAFTAISDTIAGLQIEKIAFKRSEKLNQESVVQVKMLMTPLTNPIEISPPIESKPKKNAQGMPTKMTTAKRHATIDNGQYPIDVSSQKTLLEGNVCICKFRFS